MKKYKKYVTFIRIRAFGVGGRQRQIFGLDSVMKRKTSLIAVLLICFLLPLNTWAAASLSVTPLEGGNSLRFGRITSGNTINKQVRIRVTSDLGVKYQVEQRLLEPLRNDRGELLNAEAFDFYTLRGSNLTGSLYQDTPYKVDTFKRILYVSSAAGTGDSFSVIYSANPSKINISGNFFGRILYTFTPLGAGGTQREVILNVYFETEKNFQVSLKTSSQSSRTLRLSPDKDQLKGYLQISTEGSLGGKYEIKQVIQEPFKNEKGEVIPLEMVKVSASSNKGQIYASSPTPLAIKPLLIYGSQARGEGDEIVVNFSVNIRDFEELPSGHFKALVLYSVESSGSLIKRLPVDVSLEIKPIFDIEVISDSIGGLYFRNLKSDSGSIEKEIIIKVKTNLNRPYSVVQNLITPLANQSGNIIPLQFFRLKEEKSKDNPGTIIFSQFSPLSLGDTRVFASNSTGDSSEFKIIYSLEVPRDMIGGDYFTGLNYSLVEK